jgi:hypothetical protein
MHNTHFIAHCMEQRRSEHAYRNRHAWKRPGEPKHESPIRRAMAAVASLRF